MTINALNTAPRYNGPRHIYYVAVNSACMRNLWGLLATWLPGWPPDRARMGGFEPHPPRPNTRLIQD